MTTRLILLNGGSSSGKTTIARALQARLPEPWLAFSVDDLVDALPRAPHPSGAGITIGSGGGVEVGEGFAPLETAWRQGIAAMARAGARVVVDDVFLGGPASQQGWRAAIGDLEALWVGVRCDPEVATGREAARGDREAGMAALQADSVHRGVIYDLEVDTTHLDAIAAARTIAARIAPPA